MLLKEVMNTGTEFGVRKKIVDFNVQSRRAIVQRIMNLGGEQFILDNFIANDNVSLPEEDISRVAHQPISPLGTPVWNWCKQ